MPEDDGVMPFTETGDREYARGGGRGSKDPEVVAPLTWEKVIIFVTEL